MRLNLHCRRRWRSAIVGNHNGSEEGYLQALPSYAEQTLIVAVEFEILVPHR